MTDTHIHITTLAQYDNVIQNIYQKHKKIQHQQTIPKRLLGIKAKEKNHRRRTENNVWYTTAMEKHTK